MLINHIQKDQNEGNFDETIESSTLSMIDLNNENPERSTFEINGDFLNSKLLIDCLLKLESNSHDRKEFILHCEKKFKENLSTLKVIKDLDENYVSDHALYWYTRDIFLFNLLNKELRRQNIHWLYLLRFFMKDIEQQLNNNKCSSKVRVYRAQLLSKDEIQVLKDSLGKLISIKSFFSTTRCKETALFRCSNLSSLNGNEQALFEIDVDPHINNIKPFADISKFSLFPNEKEVLFMIGSIFRIVNISLNKDKMLIIQMKLCSIDDHHLKSLVQHMQMKYNDENTNLIDLCSILMHMGKWDDAEEYYRRCLSQSSNDLPDIASCYQGLGIIAKKNGDYELSLDHHQISLEIKYHIFEPDDPNIASSLNSIGATYKAKKDYLCALEYYEQALDIYKNAFGDDHVDVAMCMNNIANIYYYQSKYSQALELYEKVLDIREKHRPSDHPSFSNIRTNIGNVYKQLGRNDLALSNYQSSLRISEKSCPSDHPSVATIMHHIGSVYDNNHNQEKALACFEQAAKIYIRTLSYETQFDIV